MRIDIAAISLDVQNFRHVRAETEPDAIRFLLSDERTHKVLALAEDIVAQRGLDPSSLLIVTNDGDETGRYIALEGNRRITALKTLMTPDLAVGTSSLTRFRSLHSAFLGLNISTVECVVLERQQASIWIKRKHYKGVGGEGVVQWNAVATARSDASEGRFTRWMTALAYLENQGVDAEEIRDQISSKTTTVERVLSSSYMSSILGLSFDRNGTLTPENGDASAALLLVSALLEAMSEQEFVETRVSSSEQQKAFIDSFADRNVRRPAPQPVSAPALGATAQPLGSSAIGSGVVSGGGAPTGTVQGGAASLVTGTTLRSRPVTLRKKLAKAGLRISNLPLNRFYSELRALDVERNPNISAAVIRIFVEKSCAVFLEALSVPPLRQGGTWHDFAVKFKDKVDAVLRQLDPPGTNAEFTYARDVANGNRDRLHTADHLNQAIHSHLALPSHSEILTIWDRLNPFLVALFEAIERRQARP